MADHAACSPSSASMWLSCPASVTKTKGLTRPSSRYAREGTAAHHVAEQVLKGDIFLPDRVTIEGEEYLVTPGMCRALNPYIGHIQDLTSRPGARFVVEQRVVIPNTQRMVWGTLDCGVRERDGHLHVVDLKFGKGVPVEPDSSQFKLYGLGLAGLWNIFDVGTPVTLTVSQPRIGGPPLRDHETTLGDLMDWRRSTVRPAIAKITDGDQTEVPGAYCRWCVRKTECAGFNGRHQGHAAEAFDDTPELFA